MDEGTQKLEVRAQVQQAAAAVDQARVVADNIARSANAAKAALERVRTPEVACFFVFPVPGRSPVCTYVFSRGRFGLDPNAVSCFLKCTAV